MARFGAALSLCTLCYIASSLAFVFEDCGSDVGKFSEISISSCDLAEEKCILPRESEAHVKLKFTPNKDISQIEARAFGVLLDVPVPLPLEKPDVCNDPDSGINCPLKKDVEAEYKVTFFVEKKTPAVTIDLMWEFRNENDEKIVCIKFPAKVK